jgi:hypothetical protein
LHLHPYDVVSILALGWPGRPPTILFNQAGHLAWIGRRIADVVACGRRVAIELCRDRRGIPAGACHLLPVPAAAPAWPDEATRSAARLRARAELGVRAGDLVLLTIASEYKLQAIDTWDHAERIDAALRRLPGARWLLVGPRPGGRWAALESAGAMRCLGLRHEPAELYAAADIYMDSYPFTSQLALFDAAASGLPVFAAQRHSPSAAILGAWGGGLDEILFGFDDEASLPCQLDSLMAAGDRARAGRKVQRRDQMAGPRWAARLPAVYELAAERRRLCDSGGLAPVGEPPARPPDDLDRYLVALYRGEEPARVFIDWQRQTTNFGAVEAFPADEAWLAERPGLAGLVGQLELFIRDLQASATARDDSG